MNLKLVAVLISVALSSPSAGFGITTCRTERPTWSELAKKATVIIMGDLIDVRDLRWIPCDKEAKELLDPPLGECYKATEVRFQVRAKRILKGSAAGLITFTGELPAMYQPVCGEEPKLEPGLGVVVFLDQSSDGLHLMSGYNGFGYTNWGWYKRIDWPSVIKNGRESGEPERTH